MDRQQEVRETRTDQQPPREWTHLILKLRWMGLDDDAKFLELAVSTLPSEIATFRSPRPMPPGCKF